MKLARARITNYRSIKDSGEFDITDITCLVGKNEAGKTAILQALYRLNPIVPEDKNYSVDDDYPRDVVEDYRQAIEQNKIKPDTVVETTFDLEDKDTEEIINTFGKNVLKSQKLNIQKGYDNVIIPQLDINEQVVLKSIMGKYSVSNEMSIAVNKAKSFIELQEILDQLEDSSGMLQEVQQIVSIGLDLWIFNNYFAKYLPKFLYFDEYYQIVGSVNIPSLQGRVQNNRLFDSDRPVLGLVQLAGLKLEELISPQNTETLISRLEGTSNRLTRKILQYWSQNKNIELRFDIRNGLPTDPTELRDGYNLLGRVWNTKHKVTTPIGTRSKGFIWFFSFLAWFSTQQWTDETIILLLDEPALFLHAKAQEDMLRYMEEELKPNHQVIYTTHSPFMVDPKRFDRARIVEDKSMESDIPLPPEEEGTKVITDVLATHNPDSIFPLQGALGYEIYQTLFIGPNCLVVEGVSDLLYLQIMSSILERQDRVGLDPHWTITPVGGCDKVPTFVALIGSQKMNVATLIDIKPEDTQKIEGLFKKKLLQKSHVFTYGDFTQKSTSDVEDMFEVDFYLGLVNEEYKNQLSHPIAPTDLSKKPFRILSLIEEYLSSNPLKTGSFSHYRPSRFFAENIVSLETQLSSSTLDRFEGTFKRINAIM